MFIVYFLLNTCNIERSFACQTIPKGFFFLFFRFSFFFKHANSTSISEAHCEIGCRERMKCYDVVLIKFNWLHGSKRNRL